MTYVEDHIQKAFAQHSLELQYGDPVAPVALYRMGRANTSSYAIYVASFAHRLCITGDIMLGANRQGLVSTLNYGIHWFSGHLSEDYLCEKFLPEVWQWEIAVEGIEDRIEIDEEDYGWKHLAKELREFIAKPDWHHDGLGCPDVWEYCDRMRGIGCETDELPGYGYPRVEAGWLCAIQQRFQELYAARERGA